ncbi:class I glutamine amidotransferase-like protein [Leucogyrophana mollusca]|uniref:Class I glutamine amidotransferase-like protein n=1 Tax=Leucogyrophana mollusca TaxID=85980 RepID=A0ACB8BP31_9AGAM|nr:class I glutamine amidotransferase-like protein [Leucogyrophana mollusca]
MSLPPHSKIALLICDPTKEEFIDSYGNITSLFTNLYTKLLIQMTNPSFTRSFLPALPEVMKSFRISAFNVIEGQLPTNVDEYDSVMVSGSAHSVNDSDEWIKTLGKFLNETATKHPKVKLIGVCFGHQIITHAVFGNPVGANPKGWEIGPYEVTLTDAGKQIFRGAKSLNVEMFHHDAVFTSGQRAYFRQLCAAMPYEKSVPENTFHIWGHSEKTENQGIVALKKEAEEKGNLNVDDIQIFTSQGHPELTQGMTSYLLDLFEDEIDADSVAEARSRIADFDGILDWFRLTMFMWALSTRHSLVLSRLPVQVTPPHGVKNPFKEAKLTDDRLRVKANDPDESVFVLVV